MADKQTKREKRDLAKKQRMEMMRHAQRQKRMRTIGSVLIAALVIAGIAFAVVQSGKSGRERAELVNSLAGAAGCTEVQTFGSEGQTHISPPATVQYRTNPPTSGNHYGGVGPTGVHTAPIQNETQVHNLEHGHIGVQYTEALNPEVITELEKVARDNNTAVFLAPKPDLTDAPLAISSWGKLATCATPGSPAAVREFVEEYIKAYRGDAPEGFVGGQPIS